MMCAAILGFIPGPWEWMAVVVVALLLFGSRIPTMMRSLGTGIVEFKKGLRGDGDDPDKRLDDGTKEGMDSERKD